MQAVILAGGLGTRLRPLTHTTPKPLVPIKGKPFFDYAIELLKEKGIDDFVICSSYLAHKIQDYYKN
ncbi:TPA: NTP transferase domain-containing protein, partial [archaeon]|nr:NTP transferase domain-containing protein [Candidatus Naiadarchaeales archaeon SRR2090153.bin1042]